MSCKLGFPVCFLRIVFYIWWHIQLWLHLIDICTNCLWYHILFIYFFISRVVLFLQSIIKFIFYVWIVIFLNSLITKFISFNFRVKLLMNERESNIVFKLCNCKINFNWIFKIRIVIYFFKQAFCESTNYWFFIVTYHILKKLIYELNFEISEIKACIIVAIELVSKIYNDFVSVTFFLWI